MVKRTVPADKLLVFNVKEGWEPLCQLLWLFWLRLFGCCKRPSYIIYQYKEISYEYTWKPRLPIQLTYSLEPLKLMYCRGGETAVPYLDVITTSGTATGQAASLSKIRQIRAAIGDHPLAIASGLTPENITSYLPYANCFLVATGISRSFEMFDPVLMRTFINTVRTYTP